MIGYPCFCLKRGFFLLITYSLPFLLTILQSALRFLIEALTFMINGFTILVI
jgi:hypothetical protein